MQLHDTEPARIGRFEHLAAFQRSFYRVSAGVLFPLYLDVLVIGLLVGLVIVFPLLHADIEAAAQLLREKLFLRDMLRRPVGRSGNVVPIHPTQYSHVRLLFLYLSGRATRLTQCSPSGRTAGFQYAARDLIAKLSKGCTALYQGVTEPPAPTPLPWPEAWV
ncbi:hypothetical protein D3C81_1285760 [compost metagenome]